jgi:RNA polymerase sigma factor (sigma-70 family)
MNGQAGVLRQIGALFDAGAVGSRSDSELLDRFLAGRADEAELVFAALVERHGPMVLATCRRVLRDEHAAQDAFQATFLVLARRAGSIGRRERLGAWLHGVASRTARKARATAARRARHERARAESTAEGRLPADDGADLRAALEEEIARLPEKYRAPVVLCHLEGLSRERASLQLRCPESTVRVRLMRARERLRDGLARRGFAVGTLGFQVSPPPIPDGLVGPTARGAVAFASGVSGADRAIPARVLHLARGVLSSMRWHRFATLAPAGLLVGALAASGAALAARGVAAPVPAGPDPVRARAAEDGPRWTKSLPGGVTVELVGVGVRTWPEGGQPDDLAWWSPDGPPADAKPFERLMVPIPPLGMRTDTFAARVSGPDGLAVRWDFPAPSSDRGHRGPVGWPGINPDDPNLCGAMATYPLDTATATVRVGIASDEPEVVASSDGRSLRQLTTPDGLGLMFTRARATREGVSIAIALSGDVARDYQIEAVGRDGREVPQHTLGGNDEHPSAQMLVAEFPVPPDQVREFRLLARPYAWAEFRDVPLGPRPKSPKP